MPTTSFMSELQDKCIGSLEEKKVQVKPRLAWNKTPKATKVKSKDAKISKN